MDVTVETHLSILHPSELMLERSYELHKRFDTEVWRGKESFHNDEHIRAVVTASDKIFDAAEFGVDPLDIRGDLDSWNSGNPDAEIHSLQELKKVFRIGFSMHDWGNIMEDIHEENGVLVPKYLEGYRAAGAEDRTISFVDLALDNEQDLNDDERARFSPVIKHLVDQTRFMFDQDNPDSKKPFARTVRIMDQIGNDMFSENKNRLRGLLAENVAENPEFRFNPDVFYNFVHNRFPQLADDRQRQELLKIWGKQMPEKVPNLANELVESAGVVVAPTVV